MKTGIMQPYFLPYIGYFQLISAVDQFILYDNIKYTKKGWINRNRILSNNKDVYFSIPLKHDSDYLFIKNREISEVFNPNKILNQIKSAYFRAPFYTETINLISMLLNYKKSKNLFDYIHNSIITICQYLSIETDIKISSSIFIDHNLKSQDKVIEICKNLNSTSYINSIGGIDLYSSAEFKKNNIDLYFIKSNYFEYIQMNQNFIPWLSIVDVLMFNSLEKIKHEILNNYELIKG